MTVDRTSALATQARAELELLSYPSTAWVERRRTDDGTPIHAAIVVGGGQSGLAVAASLRREGVDDVRIFDRQAEGLEGVWEAFARMRELRTPKGLNGMDFGFPSLSVQRWLDTPSSGTARATIDQIPRTAWMEYLRWYRATLRLAGPQRHRGRRHPARARRRRGGYATCRPCRDPSGAHRGDRIRLRRVRRLARARFRPRRLASRPLRSHQRPGRFRAPARAPGRGARPWGVRLRQRQRSARRRCGGRRPLLPARAPPPCQSASLPGDRRQHDALRRAVRPRPLAHRAPLPPGRPAAGDRGGQSRPARTRAFACIRGARGRRCASTATRS